MENKIDLLRFYNKCKDKNISDFTDEEQLVEAEVIAKYLGLDYSDINSLYEESVIVHQKFEDRIKAKKLLDEQEKLKQERSAIKGQLLFTCVDLEEDRKHNRKQYEVYKRPDNSYYCIDQDKNKFEGKPLISIKEFDIVFRYTTPQKKHYGAVTIGGFTTGGTYTTGGETHYDSEKTDKAVLQFELSNDIKMEIGTIVFSKVISQKLELTDYVFDKYFNANDQLSISTYHWDLYPDFKKNCSFLVNGVNAETYDAAVYTRQKFKKDILFTKHQLTPISNLINDVFKEKYPPTKDEVYTAAVKALDSNNLTEINNNIEWLKKIQTYKDSKDILTSLIKHSISLEKEKSYENACALKNENNTKSCMKAIEIFKNLHSFKDSKEQLENCNVLLAQLKKTRNHLKAKKLIIIICVVIALVIGLSVICSPNY
jgi:hypothetical protein